MIGSWVASAKRGVYRVEEALEDLRHVLAMFGHTPGIHQDVINVH